MKKQDKLIPTFYYGDYPFDPIQYQYKNYLIDNVFAFSRYDKSSKKAWAIKTVGGNCYVEYFKTIEKAKTWIDQNTNQKLEVNKY